MPGPSPIPLAKPTDDEDVSWALSTAQTSWGRGDPQEALKWLRRAAEAAAEADDDMRALELAKAIAELSSQSGTVPPSPPSVPPRPPAAKQLKPPTAPKAFVPSGAKPSTPPAKPGPAVGAKPSSPPKPATPARPATQARPAAPAKKEEKRDDKKEPAAKPARSTRKSVPDAEDTALMHVAPAEEGTDTNLRAVKKGARRSYDDLTRPAAPQEIEAMQTQTMRGDELPELDYDEAGRTRVGASHFRAAITAERGGLGLVAAARVFLVRGADGETRVSFTPVEGSLAVVVVPLDASIDLHEFFGR